MISNRKVEDCNVPRIEWKLQNLKDDSRVLSDRRSLMGYGDSDQKLKNITKYWNKST